MAIKKKIYLTLLVSIFLIVSMLVFVIFPLFNRIKNNSQELIVKKEKIIELEFEILNLEKFRTLYKEVEQFLEEVDGLFIDSEMPLEFINFLEETSEKTSIEIESLSLSDKKTEKDYWDYLTFQIVCSGSFPNFLIFLEKLENNPYLIEVQNMTVSRLAPDQEADLKNIRANFSIKVFVK